MVKVIKEAFSVIGKEGSTLDGEDLSRNCGRMPTVISVK